MEESKGERNAHFSTTVYRNEGMDVGTVERKK